MPPGVRLLLALVVAAVGAALAAPGGALAGTWCGNDVAQTNRLPEAVSGRQIHVVYAFPSDGADRFSSVASAIVTDLEAIDGWWRSQDPTRAPRFDEFAFPGCAPGLTRLDLTKVRLPNASLYYTEPRALLPQLLIDLGSAAFGFTHDWAKYLVYYDGPTSDPDVCGVGHTPSSVEVAGTIAAVLLQACTDLGDLGTGGAFAWTAAHELAHTMSAVQRQAPNACEGSGHTCDDDRDLMGRFVNAPLSQGVLDFNRDDWYGHSGSWADVQDSPWLLRLGLPRPQLTVAFAGATGPARVESDPPGILCPPQCGIDWDLASEVRLTATPPPAQRFVRWRGACTNREEVCSLTMSAPRSVTAVFGPRSFRLALSVAGRGAVRTSLGTACARRCSSAVDAEDLVVLRAQPRRGHRFVRWTGACRGTRPRCTVAMTAARTVRAVFVRR